MTVTRPSAARAVVGLGCPVRADCEREQSRDHEWYRERAKARQQPPDRDARRDEQRDGEHLDREDEEVERVNADVGKNDEGERPKGRRPAPDREAECERQREEARDDECLRHPGRKRRVEVRPGRGERSRRTRDDEPAGVVAAHAPITSPAERVFQCESAGGRPAPLNGRTSRTPGRGRR